MSVFAIRKLNHVYRGTRPVHALRDVDLDVGEGEFVVLLGPSGCGKSTLLEILAGLQQPASGQVLFHQRPIAGPQAGVGVVFQDASLLPWRTVSRNVQLGLELRGLDRERRRLTAESHLQMVGLAGFGDKYPHQLSGGMRQRAGIARALAGQPEVLLMDEPFGALDHMTRLKLQEDLVTLWQEHRKTVVFVTHDVGEAVFLADRIVLLSPRPGRIHHILPVDLPRPRRRGDLSLLKLEAAIYDILHDIEHPAAGAEPPRVRAAASR